MKLVDVTRKFVAVQRVRSLEAHSGEGTLATLLAERKWPEEVLRDLETELPDYYRQNPVPTLKRVRA